MVKWTVVLVDGGEVLMECVKELPDNVTPPAYVDCINNANFLPLVGEWERTATYEDNYENKAYYNKINPFFGGK